MTDADVTPDAPHLFYSPGACSLAAHIALREAGYEPRLTLVSTRDGSTRSAGHLARNPLGLVPVLEVAPGVVLTEVAAILTWTAESRPDAQLLPADPLDRARAYEWISYLASHVQRSYWLFFRPYAATTDAGAEPSVSAKGQAAFRAAMALCDRRLSADGWALGDRFSVVDAHLFVYLRWCERDGLLDPSLERLAAWGERMRARPAVRRAMEAEGLPDVAT